MRYHYKNFFIFLILILFSCSCEPDEEPVDLPDIKERGSLIAITSYSPISYFIYHGEPMGYEYELLQMLGEYMDLQVEIKLAKDFDEMIGMLNRGEGDMIAYGLTVTAERRQRVAFTKPMNITRQVLVQRKPENWHQMKLHQIESQLIRSPIELVGQTVHVRRGSAYVNRLKNLSQEIGETIDIVEMPPDVTTEKLINLVAEDSIDLTVSDENIARIHSAYFRDIDIEMPISLPQQTAWAVRQSSPLLLEAVNEWLAKAQRDVDYYVIYNKYYENRRAFRSRYASDYFPITGDAISPYDDLLREGAEKLEWDWRMLAALTYRESQFKPFARSWAGASGLMQLMPATAREFGAKDPYDPEQNIKAGINFLLWLDNYWEQYIDDEKEHQKFVIASYNVGHGHVQDARRLAKAFDADPNVWEDNVERFMLKKSNPDYYNLEIVNFGYATGLEPVKYVKTIYDLYEHYKKFVE